MGLDMYLDKVKKHKELSDKTMALLAADIYRLNKIDDEALKQALNPYAYTYTRYDHEGEITSISKNVAYWRKANAIHNWFYENCAEEGQKDYEELSVTKEKIEELVELCKNVMSFKEKALEGFTQDLEMLLPTCSGFFFGSTEYDDYYFEDIADTIKQLEEVLKNTDFESEFLVYCASY